MIVKVERLSLKVRYTHHQNIQKEKCRASCLEQRSEIGRQELKMTKKQVKNTTVLHKKIPKSCGKKKIFVKILSLI